MRFAQTWTKCTVHATRDVTPAIREIVLRPEGAAVESYPIGSHVHVGVLIDGRPETRCYSLVGDYNPAGYRIAVRLAPDSRGGSRYMWTLKPGAHIEISSPASLLEIDWSKKSCCLIAGGIGVTPMLGIAGALMRRNADIAFHYAVKSRSDAAFLDELSDRLGDRLPQTKASESIWIILSHPCRRMRRPSCAARCACSRRRGGVGRRRAARRPTCDTRRLAPAACCRRHHFGSGSIMRAGKSWFPRTNRCWMRSTKPALR
jgi:vanillate O-demethylase ferredoxin subunit